MDVLTEDYRRYSQKKYMPLLQFTFRKAQLSRGVVRFFWKICFKLMKIANCVDLPTDTNIGGGLYMGHPYGIVVSSKAIIGKNVNIHKGVTIGAEQRGKRKGTPVIGNNVWIGINATVVGKIRIGNDVLIAPNTLVNFDVPDHSIVIGCPGIIKSRQNATEGYVNIYN